MHIVSCQMMSYLLHVNWAAMTPSRSLPRSLRLLPPRARKSRPSRLVVALLTKPSMRCSGQPAICVRPLFARASSCWSGSTKSSTPTPCSAEGILINIESAGSAAVDARCRRGTRQRNMPGLQRRWTPAAAKSLQTIPGVCAIHGGRLRQQPNHSACIAPGLTARSAAAPLAAILS